MRLDEAHDQLGRRSSSAWRTTLRSAFGEQPTFSALDFTAALRDGYSCS